MRIAIAAGVTLFLASSGSAIAAECTKGILWPYVRNPGDCLTEDEIKSGRLGSFTPAPGTIPPAAQQTATQPAATPPAQQTAAQPAPAAATRAPASVAAQPAAAKAAATTESCSKGLLWPFVREPGDCPTAAENKAGATRPTATTVKATETTSPTTPVPAVAPVAPPSASPASATPAQAAAPQPVVQPVAAQPAARAAAATCSKGVLWPFVREPGDCPTAAELKSGATRPAAAPVKALETAATPAAAVPAVTPAAPPAATPASATEAPAADSETCHKGLFWPFVRESGDCPTDAEKGGKRPGRT